MEFIDVGALIPVAGILASVAFGAMLIRFYEIRSQNRRLEHDSKLQADEKRRLEQRLAVLERIVTDRGAETAEQIEALRDTETAETRS
jgi:hypothetical protein